MNPFITVITPIRNEESHIAECVDSILNQDYDHDRFELIVVDGMSEDRTRELIKIAQNGNGHIRLLDNPQKIVPTAMNIGLKNAKGDIIIRVDGHAAIEKNYFNQCIQLLNETGADCVGGPINSINQTTVGKAIAIAMASKFGVGNSRFRVSGEAGYVDTVAFGAYRREVFEKIGLFDEELVRNQDDEFNFRLNKMGGEIYFSPAIRSRYYPRASLVKLCRQYFQYGYWKIRVLQKHPALLGLRYFVPPIFILSLLLAGLGTLFVKSGLWLFLAIIGCYFFASILATFRIAFTKGWRYWMLLPIAFAILHFSFGAGFLFGLIRFANRWSDK
jgi:glycosyltransferase involved in cell wall biosynthesis